MKTLHCVILFLLPLISFPQKPRRIEGNVKGINAGQCILAYNHLSESLYIEDTAQINANGQFVFIVKDSLPTGMYQIVMPNKRHVIQLIIDKNERDISFTTDTVDIVKNMRLKGSLNSQLFYDYQGFLRQQRLEASAETPSKGRKAGNYEKQLKDYQQQVIRSNKNSFFVKLLQTTIEPEIPTAPQLPNGKRDSLWAFYFYQNHFWDNFDFSDERLVRAPFLHQKLERYINDLTFQNEDSLIKNVDCVIQKAITGKQPDMIRYVVINLATKYEQTKIVGTEGIFVHIAEKYILKGAVPAFDTSSYQAYRERIATLKPLLINKIIPDLGVLNADNQLTSLHDLNGKFNVVFFYSTSCGHCKDAAPKLKEFYEKYKLEGVKIMPITTEGTQENWHKFIKEYHWETLTNGFGLVVSRKVDYRKDYDVLTTPTVYITDKSHKIIARKLSIDDLEPFFKVYNQHH